MLAQIFLRKKPTFWPGGLSVPAPLPIELDASVRELHGVRFQWSGEPIENGQFSTDHGVELPQPLQLEVVSTSHPDELVPNVQATRHLRVYHKLIDLARLRQPFDVVTSADIYTGMVFDSISLPRTKEHTNVAYIACSMHKLEIATVDLAQNIADAAQEIALAEQDIGAVAAAAEVAA